MWKKKIINCSQVNFQKAETYTVSSDACDLFIYYFITVSYEH